jgi:hypothetical protein
LVSRVDGATIRHRTGDTWPDVDECGSSPSPRERNIVLSTSIMETGIHQSARRCV